jgi:hypothetical protein
MSMAEVGLALLLVVIIVATVLERGQHRTHVLREAGALRIVARTLGNALLKDCASLYGKHYQSLDTLRSAIGWQAALDTATDSTDWNIAIGREPLDELMQLEVRYLDIKTARAVGNVLGAYSQTFISTQVNSVKLHWLVALDPAALEHNDGLTHDRHYAQEQVVHYNAERCRDA